VACCRTLNNQVSSEGMSKAPELDDALQRVFKAPKLLRINGIGIILRGEFLDARVLPGFYAIEVFTFFWIPLVPGRIFLVSSDGLGYFKFFAEIRAKDFWAIYGWRGYFKLLWSASVNYRTGFLILVAWLAMGAIFKWIENHFGPW
jgi:hypothetical protein